MRQPDVVVHFEYNNSESSNITEMLFNQIDEQTGPIWQW